MAEDIFLNRNMTAKDRYYRECYAKTALYLRFVLNVNPDDIKIPAELAKSILRLFKQINTKLKDAPLTISVTDLANLIAMCPDECPRFVYNKFGVMRFKRITRRYHYTYIGKPLDDELEVMPFVLFPANLTLAEFQLSK